MSKHGAPKGTPQKYAQVGQAKLAPHRDDFGNSQSSVGSLEHGALALLRASKNKLGHCSARLFNANVDQSTANGGTLIAANAGGSEGAVDSTVAGAVLGNLALGADGAVVGCAQTSNALLARKASTTSAVNTVGVVVRQRVGHLSLAHWAGASSTVAALAATADSCAYEVAYGLSALACSKVLATLMRGRGADLKLL